MLTILTLALMGCTTTDPEKLPDWAGLRSGNEAHPIEGGGYLSLVGDVLVWPDDADWTLAEKIASGLVLDIIGEDRAILTSVQFTADLDECWDCGTSGEPCTDVVRAVGDGFELTVCGEPFTLGPSEPWPEEPTE